MLLALNTSPNLYQFSFLSLLLGLGVWVVKEGLTPAQAAPQPAISTYFSRSPLSSSRPRQGRRFVFQPGGSMELAPRNLSAQERYDYYAALCDHLGRPPYRTTVLALRGVAPQGARHDSGDNMSAYDDTFVVLKPDAAEAREFLGSTHAGQAVSSMSPRGVAQIQPGVYSAEPVGDFNGMAAWWVTNGWGDGRIPCWRDADGSGFIGHKERQKTLTATEILFHNGRDEFYGTSIGCQVLPPDGMRNFIKTVGEAESFDYVLVDANRPIPRAK